ncbi:MAG: tRNA preQ1(34) S-adenosylmethionine ribosyltransferase-isomerase QueA [Alphaproteobacteria bacterium]|nr:tRNA preQ1(34) S-adenosylmethionine ribosyltransferase-isomerase QueA [Alphaproteobacteria bacterium]
MKLEEFDFHLPPERIAQAALEPRDSARLLCVGDTLADRAVRDLPELLRAGDLLVFNDTKVIPARLMGKRGFAKVEILLHHPLGNHCWEVFAKPAKRLLPGDTVVFAPDFEASVETKRENGMIVLQFDTQDFEAKLERYGQVPLPPYIARPEGPSAEDKQRYQTVYAREPGAVAAPTAGLHFTPELLARLKEKGIDTAYVTLHVGAGTFQPVKAENIADHNMHYERYALSQEAADAINTAKAQGRRIVAVGTTSVRVLESAADKNGILQPFTGETSIFITPGYRFKIVDTLMTNFHLPKSTLFMLICAFAGMEKMKRAYAHAIETGYRFYSYGDACLLERSHA